MQALLLTLIECSAAMTVISLAYMAVMPLLSKRYSAKWLYYGWLIIVMGWIIPFRPRLDATLLYIQMPSVLTVQPKSQSSSDFLLPIGAGQEISRSSLNAKQKNRRTACMNGTNVSMGVLVISCVLCEEIQKPYSMILFIFESKVQPSI